MIDGLTILAGASGDLGGRIARALIGRGARVRALVRPGVAPERLADLRALGVSIETVDFGDAAALARACAGGSCVVSALSGLRAVIVDAQSALLDAAVAAGVPRFIPSDYCIDYTRLPRGANRNLDLRADFRARVDSAPIRATSILNGMFADLLTGQAPVVLFPLRRVVYWGDADQPLDFTTIDDTAAFTAAAALDPATPRDLRIAGDVQTARGLAHAAGEATGRRFRLLRAGGLGRLDLLIRITRAVAPARDVTFPPWQGMQYLRDMAGGRAKLTPLDNDRYPELRWTTVREVLAAHHGRPPGGSERAAA
jgi:nucleoside-diphosphate-sugar epimerase